ncbi:inactive pancreatic lipase-related protein 1-like [Synchiropus splendidus]|uniref:inactive pancreatic lipase-related protein 1-like n=1 Tax=Synchiropus splendidus TaxID=270530 RepID=UPI00237EDD76|nr:inactive pancreatic lipase-related protein 1-like [Synchiropus splendidus]
MSFAWTLGLLCLAFAAAHALEVCYEELGCFDNLPPWGGTDLRPSTLLPWKPEEINTRFLLFTQKNRYYQEIKKTNIQASNYSGLRKTRFIIPGHLESGDEDWPQDMCKEMLSKENVNCIAVEWKKGVSTNYAQAVNNGRVLAAQVESMLTFIMVTYKQTAEKFHIIGHGVGAHVAGDVGSRVQGLAQITGLDPLEPYFSGADAAVRLDTSDATFVDVIHTDGLPFNSKLGLGMSQPMGHVDFYPNGGELMPGCSKNKGKPTDLDAIWLGTKKFDFCNHQRAYQFYSEAMVTPRGFEAFPCVDAETFAEGKCFPCTEGQCPHMGLHTAKLMQNTDMLDRKYFLTTGNSMPFSRYSYKVKVTLDGPSWPNPGYMYVALADGEEVTKEFQLHVGTLSAGKTYEVLINAEVDVGSVTEVKFRWNNHIVNILKPKYGASKVEVLRGDNKISVFCGTGNVVENEVQSVLPCST